MIARKIAEPAYRSSNSATVRGSARANVTAKIGKDSTATHAAVCQ